MAATLPLREALNESICSGRLEDTKIIIYSRRDSSGTICRPKALYANSHVLKTVSYFDDQAESKDFPGAIDDSESAEDYGYHSHSDLEEDEYVAGPGERPKKTVPLRGHLFGPFCFTLDKKESRHTDGKHKEHPEKGKVIKIQDVAFITFQAFLLYLYTGDIEFAPYGSEENRKSRAAEILSVSEDSIPRPSPKSIYRLADKYDIPPLKELALDSIRDGLKQCDIVEEVFSEFASKYQEVRTAQVNYLASIWFRGDEEPAEGLGKRIDKKVDSYANGELDHAMEAMTLLWELSREDGDLPPIPAPPADYFASRASSRSATPSVESNSVSEAPSRSVAPSVENISASKAPSRSATPSVESIPLSRVPGINRKRVKIALIRSIRKGIFFDRKYWTKHSKTARALRPLYISGIVVGEKLSYINGLVKSFREDECLDMDSEPEDSDRESHLQRAGDPVPEYQVDEKKESEQEPLPVIAIGSLASWRSLFFYLCTGVIEFAPLISQGADARAQYVREQTMSDKPPPCSPKVIYSLAGALDIKPLRDLAFDDIRSKITSVNVVPELFSGFSSRESDVMKIHCNLLGSEFHEKSTTASTADLIRGMVGGTSPHRAGALKLALRSGSSRGRVLLRCPLPSCRYHHNPTSYCLTGPQLTCPQGHYFMECAHCGEKRPDTRRMCRRCGKWFR